MRRPRIFIDGEAGTTGLQIRARLEHRTDLDLVAIEPERRKDPAERQRLLNEVDLAVLCLPDAAAVGAVALIEAPTVRVLDASSAHRTAPGWVYGFPEMTPGQAELIRTAARVSNPGCYAIGAVALLRPLTEAGLMPADHPVAIHAVEGYSGGGRQLIEEYEAAAAEHPADAYRLYALALKHKHVPEIQANAGLSTKPLFWPGYGRWYRGMLVQVPLQLATLPRRPSGADLRACLTAHYAGSRFVTVMPADWQPTVLTPEALNGTNRMELAVFANEADGHALLIARADNLGKGASGSAAQNIDLMLGLDGASDYALPAALA
jgi:N-acetyl-gamma-glutamyl-phosphate reductase